MSRSYASGSLGKGGTDGKAPADLSGAVEDGVPRDVGQGVPPADARRFVQLICGDEQTPAHFQTADDNKVRRDPALACSMFGTLFDQHGALLDFNDRGAAVWMAINELTSGEKRAQADVVRFRGAWTDLDTPMRREALKSIIETLPIAPSAAIETSPERFQLHWLLEGKCGAEMWAQIMAGIDAVFARHGADRSVKKPKGVMRVPGYFHQKGEPFRVRFIDALSEGRRYPVEQLRAAFPAPEETQVERDKPGAASARRQRLEREVWAGDLRERDRRIRQLHAIDQKVARDGPLHIHEEGHEPLYVDPSDRDCWVRFGVILWRYSQGADWGYEAWCAWSRGGPFTLIDGTTLSFNGAPEWYDDRDQRATWSSFKDPLDGRRVVTIRTIGFVADQYCGHRSGGRRAGRPVDLEPSDEVKAVMAAGQTAVSYPGGLTAYMDIHHQQFVARYGPKTTTVRYRLMTFLAQRLDPASGTGKLPKTKHIARAIETSQKHVSNELHVLARDGFLLRSSARKLGADGTKGSTYVLTLPDHIIADGVHRPSTATDINLLRSSDHLGANDTPKALPTDPLPGSIASDQKGQLPGTFATTAGNSEHRTQVGVASSQTSTEQRVLNVATTPGGFGGSRVDLHMQHAEAAPDVGHGSATDDAPHLGVASPATETELYFDYEGNLEITSEQELLYARLVNAVRRRRHKPVIEEAACAAHLRKNVLGKLHADPRWLLLALTHALEMADIYIDDIQKPTAWIVEEMVRQMTEQVLPFEPPHWTYGAHPSQSIEAIYVDDKHFAASIAPRLTAAAEGATDLKKRQALLDKLEAFRKVIEIRNAVRRRLTGRNADQARWVPREPRLRLKSARRRSQMAPE